MWPYDIWAFDINTQAHYDKITIICNDLKRSTSIQFAINILCNMPKRRSNVCLGIKLVGGLKTFVEEWNGHPLKFDELLQ